MKCKNGPGCRNHDWGKTSPVKMVCKNGPACARHDWGNRRNPLNIKCNGPCYLGHQDCRYHDWDGFLTRHSIDTCGAKVRKVKKVKKIIRTKVIRPEPVIP